MKNYENKKCSFKLASIISFLLVVGLSFIGCGGGNSYSNEAITLEELYQKHKLTKLINDEYSGSFNAAANYALNAYSDTPYAKYVAETIITWADGQDPDENLIYELGNYYYSDRFDKAHIEKIFLEYAPSFRKDNTDFKYEREVLVANKDEIIDSSYSRYIANFDKKHGTNLKELDYPAQLRMEEILKSNIGGEYEQEINEIVAMAPHFFEEKNPLTDEIVDGLLECGNIKYLSLSDKKCKIGLVPLSVFSDTARKKAPYQFEKLIEPKEIKQLIKKEKDGTITKNEEALLKKVEGYMGESYMAVKRL